MNSRTTQRVVKFSCNFSLNGIERMQPPGDYLVEMDDELVDICSRMAWRRVGTFIHLPAIGVESEMHQMVSVSVSELEAALEKDREKSL